MNSTFMFGEDRFGESEVFYTTYQQVANGQLSSDIVERTIRDCYQGLFKDYEDPGKYDDFPSLHEGLLHYGGIDEQHVEDMTQLFVRHEIGIVPQDHANLLQNWSSKYQLGVVSNIWAKKEPWLEEFRRVGIDDIWQTIIFSSNSRSIKPSMKLFQQALNKFDVAVDEIVFIGDSSRVDMEPAKSWGWILFGSQKQQKIILWRIMSSRHCWS